MREIICYTAYLPEGAEQNITFLELLLDENWADGRIECPEEVYHEVGDRNSRLSSKQNYEFLLRAVLKYPLKAVGISRELPSCPISASSSEICRDGYRTDCYIAGKYKQELLSSGYFNSVIELLSANASQLPNPEEAMDWLEKMISHAPEYYEIDDDTQPILIYRGSSACYSIPNLFTDELTKALRLCRQKVETFDMGTEGYSALSHFIGRRFKAVVGIQCAAFSHVVAGKINLHNLIFGPKYDMILDHPIGMKEYAETVPENYYLLLHDRNYLSFAGHYYQKIKGCFYFPPAGTCVPENAILLPEQKQYDITFIGTYQDYRTPLSAIYTSPSRPYRIFCARLIHEIRQNPNEPAETSFQKVLVDYHIDLNDSAFLSLFYEVRVVYSCIIPYYREKVIRTLLDAGIEIHVYGDSWKNAPFTGHKCLICHPALNIEDSLHTMQQSRISLNIMSWHKDGITERILNAMLCHSVVLSDRSTRLEEEFIDEEEILLFDLTQLDTLPCRINALLSDYERLRKISEQGYQKAIKKHLWIHRAKQLLELIRTNA